MIYGDEFYEQSQAAHPDDEDAQRQWREDRYQQYMEQHPNRIVKGRFGWEEHPDVSTKIEHNSELVPDHYFKVGYFRSSYNDGGINSILRKRNLSTLHDIFPESEQTDDMFRPDWVEARRRAGEVLQQLRDHEAHTGGLNAQSHYPNIFGTSDHMPDTRAVAHALYQKQWERFLDGQLAAVTRYRERMAEAAAQEDTGTIDWATEAQLNAYVTRVEAARANYQPDRCRTFAIVMNPQNPTHVQLIGEHPQDEAVAVARYVEALIARKADTLADTMEMKFETFDTPLCVRSIVPGVAWIENPDAMKLVEHACFYITVDDNPIPEDADNILNAMISCDAYSNREGVYDFTRQGTLTYAFYFGRNHVISKPIPALYAIEAPYRENPDDEPLKWYCDALRIVMETADFVLAQEDSCDYWMSWSG